MKPKTWKAWAAIHPNGDLALGGLTEQGWLSLICEKRMWAMRVRDARAPACAVVRVTVTVDKKKARGKR